MQEWMVAAEGHASVTQWLLLAGVWCAVVGWSLKHPVGISCVSWLVVVQMQDLDIVHIP